MAIRGQRHINVSKQTLLLAGADVAPPNGAGGVDHMNGKCLISGIE